MKDYYAILGIDKNATQDEISAVYRKLALQHHPDRNPGDEEAVKRFKEVSEAFEVLGDVDKRKQYDSPSPSFGGHNIGDIFSSFFGGNPFGGHRRRQRDSINLDITDSITLSFEEAALGCTKEIKTKRAEICPVCTGSGVESWKQCHGCGGKGTQTVSQAPFMMHLTCPACQGEGRSPDKHCTKCKNGYIGHKEETINIQIPPGAEPGWRVRVPSYGNIGKGRSGDLFIIVEVQPHDLFSREGDDILAEISVPYSKMVLGGDINISTLHGEAKVVVKPGTKSGTRIRLAKMGVPTRSSTIGDMYVFLNVEVPTELSPSHRKVIEKLSKHE